MKTKLNLDKSLVAKARMYAKNIASETQQFIDRHTTVSVERAICRLLGINGVNSVGAPLPNVVIAHLADKKLLSGGVAYYLGNAVGNLSLTPQEIAEGIDKELIDLSLIPRGNTTYAEKNIQPFVSNAIEKIKNGTAYRKSYLKEYGDKDGAYIYLIVATGNIYEDITQAKAAVAQGADIIAVIRTTGQSLLDYVPYGATTEGFGGTYATQENFRLMRKALDEAGAKEKRYIRLCNYCSGLCMPEIAAIGALERLDVMLNDALYGILFRDINMKRTLVDQYFSRVINGYAGIIINTGEDNYLTTSDAVAEAHTVLASQFLNEQLALLAGIPENQMGLGHAFEMDPSITNSFLLELSQAQMAREIFPNAPLKYMPPTKHMTGNIFKGHIQNTLFNMVTAMTGQKIHLLGMLTEALHTPFMSDRALAIENAEYVFNAMQDINDEITFKKDGLIQKRAADVLFKTVNLLEEIERYGLFRTLEKGVFAGIKRMQSDGKGLEGIASKDEVYFNPFIERMKEKRI